MVSIWAKSSEAQSSSPWSNLLGSFRIPSHSLGFHPQYWPHHLHQEISLSHPVKKFSRNTSNSKRSTDFFHLRIEQWMNLCSHFTLNSKFSKKKLSFGIPDRWWGLDCSASTDGTHTNSSQSFSGGVEIPIPSLSLLVNGCQSETIAMLEIL